MKYLLLFLLFTASLSVYAQDPVYYAKPDSTGPTFRLVLKTGVKLRGRILYQDEKVCRILTEEGMELEISPSDILRSERTDIRLEQYPNVFPHRLIFYPTAFPMAKHSIEYSNNEILVSRVGYGLTKHFSVAGSFTSYDPRSVFALHAKWTVVDTKLIRVAVDGSAYSGRRAKGILLLPQVLVTVGTSENNLTLGGGVVFDRNYNIKVSRLIVLGGVTKISRGTSLLMQNQILVSRAGSAMGILALAARMNGRKAGFDGGLMVLTGSPENTNSGIFVLPYFGFMLKLGRR
ncbi:hypothetical protein [Siphonobacter aquaeclarae]|uniref:Phosphodiester glycosidase domain-containing protein n=1 Tax=Siphonobacter aquaeclarae TaxID=563176 RepID=A0A1G9RXJ8_9BACT|nr:hypothetical protein [Siphonobacter aquaeclarae]SDM27902.1 hypothetical protein SAMN04488090_3090 [Siphonobacter aquaeclarae]